MMAKSGRKESFGKVIREGKDQGRVRKGST